MYDDTQDPAVCEPIAIVGIGCRFPGIDSPDAFWRHLVSKTDLIGEVPPERYDLETYYDPEPATAGKTYARWGGFLEQIDQFDSAFFGISPREVERMDPQQRILLETTWEAFEDAGIVSESLHGTHTGVFIGSCYDEFLHLEMRNSAYMDLYVNTGGARSVNAGRISYAFGLQGPSLAVDTACSSSLVAVHLACQSLRAGECDLALAGGSNVVLLPEHTIGFSHARMLAPDGRCKAFDSRADGFVRSEGVGVVVLKPLDAARRDGDPIYARILASGANNDGRTSGLMMTPGVGGQEDLLRTVYRRSGIEPASVDYIECHGTGTSVGDPVEAGALGKVFGAGREAGQPCILGSVKSNFGHTEGAAGIAGLIKACLCLKHRTIPASLHLETPNPEIPWDELRLAVSPESAPWPERNGPARAGVNAFGINGTNAHVVLEEEPLVDPSGGDGRQETRLLALSAHTPEALRDQVARLRGFVDERGDAGGQDAPFLSDLVHTAAVRRSHHRHRMAVVFDTRDELLAGLDAHLNDEPHSALVEGQGPLRHPRIAFVFPGQGGQWLGMGRQLKDSEPVFHAALEKLDAAIRAETDWSLLEQIEANESGSRLDEVDVIQPMTFAMQVALSELWRSWGIEPFAVVGQSLGEVAASHIAGALSLEDAVKVICRRSRLVRSTGGEGGMAAVELSLDEARGVLEGYEKRVSVAVTTGPTSTVLSGDLAALDEILARLEARDVFCRRIKVDYASHSPHMDPLLDELRHLLEGVSPQSATVPICSTVSGRLTNGAEYDTDYWARNLREPVLFSGAIQLLLEEGCSVFLEISPHPLLLNSLRNVAGHFRKQAVALPSLRRHENERASLLGSLGGIYLAGYPVEWQRIFSQGRCLRLPPYSWQRESFWIEGLRPGESWKHSVRPDGSASDHPLLGWHLESAVHGGTHFWETDINTRELPFLDDHRVQGEAMLPAAAMLEMGQAAAARALDPEFRHLAEIEFRQALFVPSEPGRRVQVTISSDSTREASFQITSRQEDDPSWTLHARGTVRRQALAQGAPADLDALRQACPEIVSEEEHYAAMARRGLEYGTHFRGVQQLLRGDGEALGRLSFPSPPPRTERYRIHPALLDAGFQVLAGCLPSGSAPGGEDTFLPVAVRGFQAGASQRPVEWCHARLRPVGKDGERFEGDVRLLDAEGGVVCEAFGLEFQSLGHGSAGEGDELDGWLYEIGWTLRERPAVDGETRHEGTGWLVCVDRHGVGEDIAARLESAGAAVFRVAPGTSREQTAGRRFTVRPEHRDDFTWLLSEIRDQTSHAETAVELRGVLHLWGVDAEPLAVNDASSAGGPGGLWPSMIAGCGSAVHLAQAVCGAELPRAPRLWLVTRGTQAAGESPAPRAVTSAALWGFGRSLANEHPELACTLVDLSWDRSADEAEGLFAELLSEGEDQLALRGHEHYAARLARSPGAQAPRLRVGAGQRPFQVQIDQPGLLDRLGSREIARRPPGPGEVEIEVRAASLNFIDVLQVMGVYPGQEPGAVRPGGECAGRIVAVGEGVEDLAVGDDVVALCAGSMSTHVTVSARSVARKPATLGFEAAAAVPSVFMTVHYAFHHLARLRRGERVLIHSASGGTGLAAVQLAQRAGAEIFATAGNEAKRKLLRSMDIRHVMDSRSAAFAGQILDATDGEGVDVVLNSLAGELMEKSLGVLGPYGRFLELSKRDIYSDGRLGLSAFRKSLSYFAIDLAGMATDRPALYRQLLEEVMTGFADDTYTSLPVQVFPVAEVSAAFRSMAQAEHIGKIVVSFEARDETRIEPASRPGEQFRADATYLLTGGLGGLGLSVSRWMVDQGARHLVLLGRSAPSGTAAERIAELEAAGARVTTARADVACPEDLEQVFAQIDRGGPPLGGVIHAAGVLDDATLQHLDLDRLRTVMAPKAAGAWNLHRLTAGRSLDHFVVFSSAASVFGSPGQGNYSAANAFLDTLAFHRQAQGLPAMSINWGPWSEVGLAAAQDNRGARLEDRGMASMTPEEGVEVLGRLLLRSSPQVAVMPVDWRRWCELDPHVGRGSMLRHVAAGNGRGDRPVGESGSSLQDLITVPPEEREARLEEYLRREAAQVLRLSPDQIDLDKPLAQMGLDSLMALELKNRIDAHLGVGLAVARLLKGLSLADAAREILDEVASDADQDAIPEDHDWEEIEV